MRGHRHKKGRVALTVVRREAEDPSGRTQKERRGRGNERRVSADTREREREIERTQEERGREGEERPVGRGAHRADIDRGLRLRGKRRERGRSKRAAASSASKEEEEPLVPRRQSIVASTRNGLPPAAGPGNDFRHPSGRDQAGPRCLRHGDSNARTGPHFREPELPCPGAISR